MALNAEKIAKLPVAQKMAILGGVVLMIFAAYYVFMDSDYKARQDTLGRQLTDLKSEIVKIRAIAAEKEKFERENALLNKKLEELKAKLPSETEIDKLLIRITEMGRDNGLTFTAFQPGKESGAALYVTVPVSMKFKGNFHHVLRFFDQVSKYDRIVNISKLNIKMGKGELLNVSCTAETYKFKEAKKGTKAPTR
jgi:type IV pilus assembly protein PilO